MVEVQVEYRHVDVVVFPQWDWAKVFRAASSGFLANDFPCPDQDQAEYPAIGRALSYASNLVLVRFGQSAARPNDLLGWGAGHGLRPATVREVMSIPVAHPDFFRMFGYRDSVLVHDQLFTDYGSLSDGWDPYQLAIACPTPIRSCLGGTFYSLKCVDHGDLNHFSYWACADVFDGRGAELALGYDIFGGANEADLWLAFARGTGEPDRGVVIDDIHAAYVPTKYKKEIVCFANSRKASGRCIAGKEWRSSEWGPRWQAGGWVRPVSRRASHELTEEERQDENGQEPQLLEYLDVPCDHHDPQRNQSENHVVDPRYYWSRRGRENWDSISHYLDHPSSLWGAGQSSWAGINNRLEVGREDGTSLFLVQVAFLRLLVGRKTSAYSDSKRSVMGEFDYKATPYRLDVTDPVIEQIYLQKPDGEYEIADAVICVSLGDPYQGYFYKLIAGVLYAERFEYSGP